ncbi:hypothetical protein CCMA1212_005885 [Trichoderma ghanense]|uniref:Uncharacterized protein n=1 Tax=Trichoderma ghanense TaxID=65468 RepID=A0ABY2H2F5_9HYPO
MDAGVESVRLPNESLTRHQQPEGERASGGVWCEDLSEIEAKAMSRRKREGVCGGWWWRLQVKW